MTQTNLIAALDDSAAARPVLDVARHLAAIANASVHAVHVCEDGSGSTAQAIAEAASVPFHPRGIGGADVVRTLDAARRDLHASAVVAGARGVPSAARPVGHIALCLMQELDSPVVLVPPLTPGGEVKRVLVAIEGDGESDALLAMMEQLDAPNPEVVALHVFAPEDLPLFGDEPVYEREAWAGEFLRRAASGSAGDVRLELRVGNVVDEVPAAVRDLDADLVVMGWHGTLDGGHGRVVWRALESVSAPLLLIPIGRSARL
jgi:nucleotide-binding universal stress UspA family protein